MNTKNKIMRLLAVMFTALGLLGATIAWAADVNLNLQLEKSGGNNLRLTGYLDNYNEGVYVSSLTKDVNNHTVRVEMKVSVMPKEIPLCTELDWEYYECGDCVNNKQQCVVRKIPGIECLGELGKPAEIRSCLSVQTPVCDQSSWELINCSLCANGVKTCAVRKKWGVACLGEEGKPSASQTCAPGDPAYCDGNSWEFKNCDYCREGKKQCEVRKKWGVVCEGETGKPKGETACNDQDLWYCTEDSWELTDCEACQGGEQECAVKKKEGEEACVGEEEKPESVQACQEACTAESWELAECGECVEGKQECAVQKKDEFAECVGETGKPAPVRDCVENLLAQEKSVFSCDLFLPVAVPFQDIAGHWGEQVINQLRLWGVVHGKTPGWYAPEDSLTRAEFTKIALNAFCISTEDVVESGIFPDVTPGSWYTRYVIKAKTEGIIVGYNDGYFRPDQPINRSEAIKIILETAQLNVPETGGAWYEKYLKYAQENKVISSQDEQNKSPAGTITRAEMAKITVHTKNLKTSLAVVE